MLKFTDCNNDSHLCYLVYIIVYIIKIILAYCAILFFPVGK